MSYSGQVIDILLVEDNPGDAKLVQKAFELGKLANRIWHVPDGERALQFLHHEGEFAEAPRPDIILLDLNMPGIDGREVLSHIKNSPDLMTIPVIIMTTSSAEQDILESYKLHVNCYITKPVQVQDFITVVKTIDEFWIGVVKLPRHATSDS
ncbi:MAG: response regulator [Armatimonadetes bacterium]|nr:response regulator [Armatimonadota bacterium]MBS1704079.1 response regulator [Armatimonadota bacterium]MBS1725577.1 response regulator [Armatimonadota bacterium]